MRLLAIAILVALTPHLGAQVVATRGSGQAAFSSNTQLVVETVTVTGKSGNPVKGLSAKDFTITENGTPQQIRVFDEQKLQDPPVAAVDTSIPQNIHVY